MAEPDRVPKHLKTQNRWRAGVAPKYANDEDDEDIEERLTGREQEEVDVKPDITDRRLARLAAGRAEAREGREGRHREVAEAEILEGDDETQVKEEEDHSPARGRGEESSDEEDEDALEARRERLRALAKQRAAEREEETMPVEEEEEEEANSSDSWEYESESEEEDSRRLVKPVFVPKTSRATIEEREKIEAEYEAEELAKGRRAEERKAETRVLVAEELKKEKQVAEARNQSRAREDTDDEGNEDEEYEKWRLRELKRIKRDREEREQFEREKQDVERRRTMTDAEVMAENKAQGLTGSKEKAKMVFMQKFHHKGVFYMEKDEKNKFKEDIYNRDTNNSTEADRATAKLAEGPYEGSKVLQVRRGEFGKMGQTKWTHLSNEDTTKQDSPWAQNDTIRQKFKNKTGGYKGSSVQR